MPIPYYGPEPMYRSPYQEMEGEQDKRKLTVMPMQQQQRGNGMLNGIPDPVLLDANVGGGGTPYYGGGAGSPSGQPGGGMLDMGMLNSLIQPGGGSQGPGDPNTGADFRSGLSNIDRVNVLAANYDPLGRASYALPNVLGAAYSIGNYLSAAEIANALKDEATYRGIDGMMANDRGYGPIGAAWGQGFDAVVNGQAAMGTDPLGIY
jgi:hypothetical protein